jgi:SnoaL-like domain
MPWIAELFSAGVVERLRSQAADARAAAPVPYFAGVRSGETEALVRSFAGEPELHHPIRGRVKGRRAFERFVAETNAWLTASNAVGGDVERIVTPRRGVEETVMTLDGHQGRVELPVAIVADRNEDGRIMELRIYYSTWPLTGRHATRPPLLQPDPHLQEPDIVGDYQRALAAGDVEAAVAAFESDGYVREPAGGPYVHSGRDELVALYELFFSNGGGIPLEHCTVTDDGRSCVLEYNVVRWGRTELPPQAGLAVYVRGSTGKLASARIYDDADPPLNSAVEEDVQARDGSLEPGP